MFLDTALVRRAPNGREQTFSLSNGSTSDVRGDLNEASRMKRFAKANQKVEPPKTALSLALTQAKVVEPRVRRRITIELEPPPPPPSLAEVPPPPGLSGNAVAAALKLTAAAHPARYDEQLAQFIDRALATFAPGPT